MAACWNIETRAAIGQMLIRQFLNYCPVSNPKEISPTFDLTKAEEPLLRLVTSREFEKVVTVAKLARRGSFVIGLYNTQASRQALVGELRRRVAPLPVFEFSIDPKRPDAYAYIATLMPEQRKARAVVSITNIEAGWDTAPQWLDQQRDKMAAHPHTLIIWIQYNMWGKLAERAPNFFSRHSGVFDLRLKETTGNSQAAAVPPTHPQQHLATEPGLQFNSVAEWEKLVTLYRGLLAEQEASPQADERTRFDLHYRLARLYQARSFYSKAQIHYQRAYALLDREANPAEKADMLYNLGRMRYYGGNHDIALASYNQALKLFRDVGDRLGEANTLQAIGDVQQFRKDTDDALNSYNQALKLFRDVGDRLGEANTLQAIGVQQLNQGEGEAGLETMQAALNLYEQIGDRSGQANIYWDLGVRLANNGALNDAEKLISRAAALGNEFAPGHPVTLHFESVLAALREQIAQEEQTS
jgi:tetratricopeptide (TPR) repeat protein